MTRMRMRRWTVRTSSRRWRAVVVVSVALVAFAPCAGVAAADPVVAPPLPAATDLSGVLDPELIAEMSAIEQRVLAEQQQGEQLQQEQQQTETKIQANSEEADALEQKASDLSTKLDALNEQAAALSEQIDAHNAEPHTFELPDQAAQAEAYDAEAEQLQARQNQLRSRLNELNSDKSALAAQENKLESEATQLDNQKQRIAAQITAYDSDVEQLEARIQQLLQQVAEALQVAAAEQLGGSGGRQAAGGDQGRPARTFQDDGQAGDDGGDPSSPKPIDDALDRYSEDNDVSVYRQPVRVLLTPGAVSHLQPDTAAGLSPSRIYDGLAPDPGSTFLESNQTYTALEVVAPGAEPDPFARAINQGGRATVVVDGRMLVITKVQTVPGGRPSPEPPTAPAPDPAILALLQETGQIELPGTRTSPGQDPDPLPKGIEMLRPLPGENSPDSGNKPRERPERCTENWQDYGPLQPVVHEGRRGQRATGAEACVVSVNPAPRPGLGFDLFGLRTDEGMARCHLIGHDLNGSDKDLRNFVPCYQDPTNNAWMYWRFEYRIGLQVRGGDPVYLVVRPLYRDQDPLPIGIVGIAVSNKGWACSEFIPNVTQDQALANGGFVGC